VNQSLHVHQIRLASGVNVLVGLATVISPFAFRYSGAALVNGVVVGGMIAILAALRRGGADGYRASWLSWLNIFLGGWLLIAPFALGYTDAVAASVTSLVAGVFVIPSAFWSMAASDRAQAP
jgi:hypothetical protein